MTKFLRAGVCLLLLVLLSGYGPRGIGSRAVCSFSVAGLGATYTANSLAPSCLTNPAGTATANTFWTSSSTKYAAASAIANFIFKTTTSYRDVEITTWVRQGYVFLRLDSAGNAIYFLHNGDAGSGTLEIGIVTGLDESTYPSGTYYTFYRSTDLVSIIGTSGSVCACGYTLTATDGQYFTFGANGFDIYVKYNGVQFATFKDYRQMNYGQVAVKAVTGNGFRNGPNAVVSITPTNPPVLYSHYASKQLDLRDFGARAIQTTGTISASSNSLAIAAKQNFQIGDWVIVEIGAEAGVGARGTKGVGGQWPTLSYANITAMNADTSQANNTYAYLIDTGNVYRFATPSTWTQETSYYIAKAIPYSLHGRISALSADGKTLTLVDSSGSAATATVTATNANVYLDNQPYINYLGGAQSSASGIITNRTPITPTGVTLQLPSGHFATSGRTFLDANSGWSLKGNGQTSTYLFAPNGVYSSSVYSVSSPTQISDFTLSGNWFPTGFGFASLGWTKIPGGYAANGLAETNNDVNDPGISTPTTTPNALNYPPGVYVTNATDTVIQDITVNDVSQKAIGVDTSTNVWAYRVTNNQTTVMQLYVQWQFQWGSATGGGCTDCVLSSVALVPGFESFASNGHHFVRPVSLNGAFSQNGSGAWLIQDAQLTISSASTLPNGWSLNNPLVNINTNIGIGFAALGGTISNMTMNVQGYIDTNNDIPQGIIVNASNPNVTISGGSYTAPNYAAPSVLQGPQGIRSAGTNLAVSGFTSCGTLSASAPDRDHANIGLDSGSVINSIATVIVAPTTSGNVACP